MQMLSKALECAAVGLRVHPLYEVSDDLVCACRAGRECSEKQRGKHPRLGAWQTMATTDAERVTAWWKQWPSAGIGVATGKASKVWVLDCDGDEALAWYKAQAKIHGLVQTRGAKTGRGRHFWWQFPEDEQVEIRNAQGIVPGVDVRGDGGYVVAPPTLHRSGVHYEWLTDGAYDVMPQRPPVWLVELVKVKPKPPPVRVEIPVSVTPRELRRVFHAAIDTDADVRRRLGEQVGGTYRAAQRPYVDGIRCPTCGRDEVWFYIDGGPAVCHHRNSCKWAGPLTRLGGFNG